MKLDEVRAQYQHIRLSWAHEENVRRLSSFVKDLGVLAVQAAEHRDEDLTANVQALAAKIKHRINVRLYAVK